MFHNDIPSRDHHYYRELILVILEVGTCYTVSWFLPYWGFGSCHTGELVLVILGKWYLLFWELVLVILGSWFLLYWGVGSSYSGSLYLLGVCFTRDTTSVI